MASGQLSFFSAGARPAGVGDLDGLLCGPGQVVRQTGAARVSVIVREHWRVAALRAALAEMQLDGGTASAHDADGVVVRTPFDRRLLPIAMRWSGGGAKRAPSDLALDGPRLRWWVMASGRSDPLGYVLALGPQDDAVWPAVGAALAAAGLPAAMLGPRADGPAYRISGVRRLRRLAELVGDRPDPCPAGMWPSP